MPQVSIESAMEMALAHQRGGRLRDAEVIYRQILSQQPDNVPAMYQLALMLATHKHAANALPLFRRLVDLQPQNADLHSDFGSALRDAGRPHEAIAPLRTAISLNPVLAFAHSNLANVYRDLGRVDDAITEYRLALQINPEHVRSLSNLGNALADKGQLEEAVASFRRAIGLNPNFAPAHNNLGVVLLRLHRDEEAVASFQRAITIIPEYSDAWSNLGRAYEARDQLETAIEAHRRAVQINPDNPAALCNLGNALIAAGQPDEAIVHLRRSIGLRPEMAELHNNLGSALSDKGELDSAVVCYRRAIELKPRYADAINNLATAMITLSKLAEAEPLLREAIEIDPDLAPVHWNFALLLLLRGDFRRGWEEYEWRWKVRGIMRGSPRIAQPMWDGRDLGGRTILLHAEQGFGDTMQFIRYVPMVAARGGKIVLRASKELVRLFSTLPHVEKIVDNDSPLPSFDEHCALLSLPKLFGTDLQSIPATIPYLRADPALSESWKSKLGDVGNRRKIGLAWSGANFHPNDRNRSTTLSTLAPLADVDDAVFVSLQKGTAAAQPSPAGLELRDFTAELKDFGDTAALIDQLDLVITVDTAVAHLAGAMGKPVWVILPSNPDWRWLLDRSDSPWYPTMRLFRQQQFGDWGAVVADVVKSLGR